MMRTALRQNARPVATPAPSPAARAPVAAGVAARCQPTHDISRVPIAGISARGSTAQLRAARTDAAPAYRAPDRTEASRPVSEPAAASAKLSATDGCVQRVIDITDGDLEGTCKTKAGKDTKKLIGGVKSAIGGELAGDWEDWIAERASDKSNTHTYTTDEFLGALKEEFATHTWVQYGANQSETHHRVPRDWEENEEKTKIEKMYVEGSEQRSKPRGYESERPKQALRWLSTLIFAKFPEGVEIQSYYEKGTITVSSNKTSVNEKIQGYLDGGTSPIEQLRKIKATTAREIRHKAKLLDRANYPEQENIWKALNKRKIEVPTDEFTSDDEKVDLHAERRIKHKRPKLDPDLLGGVKRPCLVCTTNLNLKNARPGPSWASGAALHGYKLDDLKEMANEQNILTYVSEDRDTGKPSMDFDSESDSNAESSEEEEEEEESK
jgi:hypothetical protein